MKRKLAVFGFAFAAAELAGACLPLPALWLTAAALFLIWLILIAVRRPVLRQCALVCASPLLGAVLGLVWSTAFQAWIVVPARALDGQTITAVATVEPGAEASYESGMLRGTLRLESVPGHSGALLVRCQSSPALQAGERFEAEFALAALADDEYRLGNYADGIYLEAEFLGSYTARAAKHAVRFWLGDLRYALRRRLYAWTPPLHAGLETAMLLGDRSGLDDGVYHMFQQAGVAHLLAVSGLHVTLLCGLLPLDGQDRRRRSRSGTVLRMALVVFYMALTGFSVSVVRAGVMLLLAQAGRLFRQPPDTLTSLGAAALLLGLHNAFAPCDVGYQLSFCAVLGVLVAAALTNAERRAALRHCGGEELPSLWQALLTVSAAIQTAALAGVATLPVLLMHGMAVSGVAVITNLLVVWMLRPALLLGVAVLALSVLPFLEPAMRMASLVLTLWLRAMLTLVRFCAALPLARLALPRRYTLWVLAVLGLLALAFWLLRKRMPMLWYLPAAVLCTVLAVGLSIRAQRGVITLALIGTSGNSCVVLTQNGHAAVLYRGGAYNESAVADYLAAHGAPDLELLVDMRQQPDAIDLTADRTVTVQQADERSELTFGSDTVLTLYHQTDGNLAVLDMGGIRAAMLAGSPILAQPVPVTVFCAGGAAPACLEPETVLTNSKKLRWMTEWPQLAFYYGGDVPSALIRPGKSLIFEEAKPLALQ